MVVVPLSRQAYDDEMYATVSQNDSPNWVRIAAGSTLLAGGILLLRGQRKAGLVAAATGTTLALLDQKDVLHSFWNLLPGYINSVQNMLGQVQATVDDVAVKREKLRKILSQKS
jgi:hypothetical protein